MSPTATQQPLAINPGTLAAGQSFTLDVILDEGIPTPFDYYLFADTPAGPYTIYLTGSLMKGIKPLYRSVRNYPAHYFNTVRPPVKIPASMGGKTITFYALAVEAGKTPPVKKPSDLTPETPYVIMMDKATAMINQ